MLFEGWTQRQQSQVGRSGEAITSEVSRSLGSDTEYRGIEDIRCVFELLNNRISRGEVEDVRANLPEALRGFWPAP